jgi:hypothetical protein
VGWLSGIAMAERSVLIRAGDASKPGSAAFTV